MTPCTILYVEDELFLGKIVKESLETRGYHVVMESDGANVMEVFHSINPDICVLDVMLPGVDGFTLASAIRESNDQIPIIFLTAKTQTADLVKGFSLGGNDYIRKPFSMEELIVRIENVMKGKRAPKVAEEPAEQVNIGKYHFHFVRQTLTSGTDERKLSFRESELLRLLYAHRDRIIDRREILNLLWGNDSFFNSRNLDVYITKLRSYLREDEQLSIITIKGVGYRFAVGD